MMTLPEINSAIEIAGFPKEVSEYIEKAYNSLSLETQIRLLDEVDDVEAEVDSINGRIAMMANM